MHNTIFAFMNLKCIPFIFFVVIFLSACGTSKIQSGTGEKVEEINMKVVSAEIKHWDGAIEGAKGDKITIKFVGNKIGAVIPDSVWYEDTKGFKSSYFLKNDTLTVFGNYSGSDKVKIIDLETGNSKAGVIKVKAPFNYTGSALMRFYISGEAKYQVIENFLEKNN